jgi:hypothetical protein
MSDTNAAFRYLCAGFVQLVERCPVTSDTDWIAQRNELIVAYRNLCRTAPRSDPTNEEWFLMFAVWLKAEMPPGTIICDPLWWAPRIARRVIACYNTETPTAPNS